MTKTAGAHVHAQEIRRALAEHGSLVMAELRIEASGEYAGAVRVFVAGVMLGSIPHGLAENFRDVVGALSASGMPATCRAELEADEYVDVWLDARPKPRMDDGPFLPTFSPFYISLGPGQAERLDAALNSKAKNKRLVTVGRLESAGTTWALVLDEVQVGTVNNPPGSTLEAVRAARFPLTCQVRVLREEGKTLRVMADLPPALRRSPL